MKPGIYPNLSDEIYFRGPGISRSDIAESTKSMRHLYEKKYAEVRAPHVDTQPLAFGRAFHAYVLERWSFHDKFIVVDAKLPSSIKWQKIQAANPTKHLVNRADLVTIKKMTPKLRKNRFYKSLLTGGIIEEALYWRDKKTGLLCKSKLDNQTLSTLVVDLKTTMDASIDAFRESSYKYGYYLQVGWYCESILQVKGKMPEGFIFFAIEKTAPYNIGVYIATEEELVEGQRVFREQLDKIKVSLDSGEWPGYSDKIRPLGLSRRAIYGTER